MNDNPKFYCQIWETISPFIKIGCMEDDKFSSNSEELILFRTLTEDTEANNYLINEEKKYTTIKDYISRINNEDNPKKIIYCTDEISQSNALSIWKSYGAEILIADTVIDSQFIPWLESKNKEVIFVRVDSEIDQSLNDDSSKIKDIKGDTDSDNLKDLINKSLNNDKITVQIVNLKGDKNPPAMILLPEQMRRINDIGALMEQRLPGLPEHHVLVINKNHPLVEGIQKLKSGSIILGDNENSPTTNLSMRLGKHLYDLARMGVGGLEANEVDGFQKESSEIMGELLNRTF
mgnify:CR=1 FL=1